MQEDYNEDDSSAPNFGDFLRVQWLKVLLILLLALTVRIGFVAALPDPLMDPRYRPTAINILEGNGFSVDKQAPYRPSEAAAPAYPLFIAAVYAVFGRNELAVLLSQAVLDLLTCLLVAFAAFSLAPPRLKSSAALWALALYGILSWPTIVLVARIHVETLTIFFMMLAVAGCTLAMRKGLWYWLGAGLACGLAILTRPDSVLFLSAFILFLLIELARKLVRERVFNLISFSLGVALVLAPWVARNYLSLGKFQPLASEYGCPQECYFPTGYLWWMRTWIKDETYFDYAFTPAWTPGAASFDPGQLPPGTYDSEEERLRLVNLMARVNQARLITPEIDQDFRSLAYERVKQAPLRFFILLPLYRTVSMWLTGFSTSHQTPYVLVLRVLSVLPIHLGGILGLLLLCRRHPLVMLLALIMLVRTAFMAYHYAPETRYMAEVYPMMIAACGVTGAALCTYISKPVVELFSASKRKLSWEEQG
ncbi:MAG TPA: glycosyltransferase family 39 protein [Pyrinomonadaceae bacterium]